MAISAGSVNFSFVGDTESLDRATARASGGLQGVTKEAKKTSKQLSGNLDKSAKSAGKRIGDLGEAAGDADSVMQGFSAALDMISPGLGNMARSAGDSLAAVESLGRGFTFANPVFLTLAAVAAVVGVAFTVLAEDEEEATKKAEDLAAANDRLKKSMDGLQTSTNDVTARLWVAQGILTEYEFALANTADVVEKRYAPAMEELTAQIITQEEALKKAEAMSDSGVKKQMAKKLAVDAETKALKALTDERSRLERLAKQEEKTERVILELGKDKKDADEDEAKRDKAKADRDKAKTDREAIDKAYRKARLADMEALNKMEEKSTEDRLTESGKIIAAAEKQLALLDELIAKYPEDAEVFAAAEAAKAEAAGRMVRDIAAIEKAEEEKRKAGSDAATDEEEKRLKDKNAAVMSSTIELTEATADAFAFLLENEKIEASKAAAVLFRIQQSAALASVAIKTSDALMTAAMLPPPADAIKAAAVWITAGVATAGIMATPAPSFHSGGVIGPDEQMVKAQTGEGVINRIGMANIGEGGLANINSGGGVSGGVIVNQWKHRIYADFVRDELSQTGSPLRQAVKKGTRVGQR